MEKWIGRWGPAVFLMVFIFGASATPGSALPKFGAWDLVVKKGGHLLGYALLSAAYFRALDKDKGFRPSQLFASLCLTILYAASDEFHQRFTPGRNASPWDVCIDTIGGLAGLTILCLARMRSQDAP